MKKRIAAVLVSAAIIAVGPHTAQANTPNKGADASPADTVADFYQTLETASAAMSTVKWDKSAALWTHVIDLCDCTDQTLDKLNVNKTAEGDGNSWYANKARMIKIVPANYDYQVKPGTEKITNDSATVEVTIKITDTKTGKLSEQSQTVELRKGHENGLKMPNLPVRWRIHGGAVGSKTDPLPATH